MERERDEALAKLDWLTMRGTDELPREDPSGTLIVAQTGDALVEYLRAQRRAERERVEKAERERDEALAEVERLKVAVAEMTRDLRKLAGDDNLPASSAAVVAMARIQTLERESTQIRSWGAGVDDLYSYPDDVEKPEARQRLKRAVECVGVLARLLGQHV